MDVDVHGGLTFAKLEPCEEHEDGQGWWFGFDCGHAGDMSHDPNADISAVSESTRRILEIERRFPMPYGCEEHYWTEGEVIDETNRLAEQLAQERAK